ncbi:MAG: hypothetical protein ACJ0O6_00070 [Candidatus Marisimplicoccus sp.]|jgi:hypothetical protein|nr:MAG: Uncharacterised protein [Flavobacteriales bacterium]
MKNLLLFTFICSLFISCASGDNNQMAETIINSTENKIVLLEIPSELTYLSDDEQYGNFEIPVPEITEDVYSNALISAYIQRTYDDDTPERWSQLPQVFINSDSSTSAYLSFGEGFIRISFQSNESVGNLFDRFSGRVLKLIIVN